MCPKPAVRDIPAEVGRVGMVEGGGESRQGALIDRNEAREQVAVVTQDQRCALVQAHAEDSVQNDFLDGSGTESGPGPASASLGWMATSAFQGGQWPTTRG